MKASRGGGVPRHLPLCSFMAFDKLAGFAHEEAARFRKRRVAGGRAGAAWFQIRFPAAAAGASGRLGEPGGAGRLP